MKLFFFRGILVLNKYLRCLCIWRLLFVEGNFCDNFYIVLSRPRKEAGFHHMVSHGQGTALRSPSLCRSNTWPLSSSWNPSTHLALVLELRRYPFSHAELTPAISPITGRLVEGGNVSFLPVQVQTDLPIARVIRHLYDVSTRAVLFNSTIGVS